MELLSQISAVFGVLAFLGACLWWLRRRGFAAVAIRRSGRRMECVERLALGPQHTLHLVRVGKTVLLLACSNGNCSLLQTSPGEAFEEATR